MPITNIIYNGKDYQFTAKKSVRGVVRLAPHQDWASVGRRSEDA